MKKKTTIPFIFLVPIFALLSCENKTTTHKSTDKIGRFDSLELKRLGYITREKKEYELDSFRHQIILKKAINLLKGNIAKSFFSKNYLIKNNLSRWENLELVSGNLFEKNRKHVLLRTKLPIYNFIDIFEYSNNRFINRISIKVENLVYNGDTITDVNGDNIKDFVYHIYPSSGCCLRDVQYVYLNNTKKNSFSEPYEFMNPTFDTKEKIIRGVYYGHSGYVGLYKYKWKGLQIDTLETIHHEIMEEAKVQTYEVYNYKTKVHMKNKKIHELPKDYLEINGYDWFRGDYYLNVQN